MRTLFGILCGLVCAILPTLLTGCSDNSRAMAAEDTFKRFQAALIGGDKATVRDLLTRESRPVIASLPWRALSKKQTLEVLGIEETKGRFQIAVRDPNEAGRESIYTVVREDSRWRVDLLATTTHNHSYHWNEGPETIVRPAVVETDGIREIRASEAASIR